MTPAEIAELRVLVVMESNRRGSQCTGKWKFPTFESAKVGIRHKGLEAYHCTMCRQYHVGTPARGRKLGIKGRLSTLKARSRERDEEMAA